MKEEVNRKDKPSIFLKKKGKQWFDDVRSSTSSKDDGNSQQDGDSTISNEDSEALDSERESNPPRRKSIRILNIQDFPQQDFQEFNSRKRKSNSTSSKEQMELELKRKTKDDKAVVRGRMDVQWFGRSLY